MSKRNSDVLYPSSHIILICLLLAGSMPTLAQNQAVDSFSWDKLILAITTVLGVIFGFYQYWRRKQDTRLKAEATEAGKDDYTLKKFHQETLNDEAWLCQTLLNELGTIKMLGLPEVENVEVKLLDTFVSLDISPERRLEHPKQSDEEMLNREQEESLTPERAMRAAMLRHRMLLIIGDPGSGKTTLTKFYAVSCLEGEDWKELGFKRKPLVLYFPLRELEPKDARPDSLPVQLSIWAKKRSRELSADTFDKWLQNRETLILLDGLDEIRSLEQRRRVCEWIDDTATGLNQARFVVTSRFTGYRRVDGIELGFDHLRAEVRDFTVEQQVEFLEKWFPKAYLRDFYDPSTFADRQAWEREQEQKGSQKAGEIIIYLKQPQNRSLRELAAVPMLLQIMAIIWKERDFLPNNRNDLYRAALIYLLQYRDERRKIKPLLSASDAQLVLGPVALWMQDKLHSDEIAKEELHTNIKESLSSIDDSITPGAFCENLRDRAGLLSDYGDDAYVFRHKSFREYLAGLELANICKENRAKINQIAAYLGDDWWEEPLRFFMGASNGKLFELFIAALFRKKYSSNLDVKQQNLLEQLVLDAPATPVKKLQELLKKTGANSTRERYLLNCLKTIGGTNAEAVLKAYAADKPESAFAGELAGTAGIITSGAVAAAASATVVGSVIIGPYRNPVEYNAEYIYIPGGIYTYSASQKDETVPDLYWAKYPVTFKRYRRFVRYLAEEEPDLQKQLPVPRFAEELQRQALAIEGMKDALNADWRQWQDEMRSTYDDNRKFNGDEQPVVRIRWYDAKAYCLWLTLLADPTTDGKQSGRFVYDLPTEVEWEWAAGGGKREYPWDPAKGNPTPELANYGSNVDATTPVDRYPDGATPEGLMDMAGNVWEWQANWYDADKKYRSLRGGSWVSGVTLLRCSARSLGYPRFRNLRLGFRVVRRQS